MQIYRNLRLHFSLLLLSFFNRFIFSFFSGYSPYDLHPDSRWIVELSSRAYQGDFDYDIGRFVAAPLYQSFIAVIKLLSNNYWGPILIVLQILFSSFIVIFIYEIAYLLFNNRKTSCIAGIIYSFYPFTFWWVGSYATETLFQSLFVISVYFLIKSLNTYSIRYIVYSATFFSTAYLTKSHILLYSPFIVGLVFLINDRPVNQKIYYAVIYSTICLLFSVPFGLFTLKHYNSYIISSNGAGFHFYTGNSEFGYTTVVDTPPFGSSEFRKMYNFEISYFNGSVHDSIMGLSQSEKQKLFFLEAVKWIRNNPSKFVELKLTNLAKFIVPGVSKAHYPFHTWLYSIMISLPIFLLGYYGIAIAIRNNPKSHYWIIGLFFSMVIFSVVFYVQNRFRVITIEPFYLIYASFGFSHIVQKIHFLYNEIKKKKKY